MSWRKLVSVSLFLTALIFIPMSVLFPLSMHNDPTWSSEWGLAPFLLVYAIVAVWLWQTAKNPYAWDAAGGGKKALCWIVAFPVLLDVGLIIGGILLLLGWLGWEFGEPTRYDVHRLEDEIRRLG